MRFYTTIFFTATLLFSYSSQSVAQPCVGGMAGIYPCNNIDLVAMLSLSQLQATGIGNDIWGWTDPVTGTEYAIMGVNNGTAFVDLTGPTLIGKLPTHSSSSSWRDVKVYRDHAFIVSEASGHGMQVFDLTELRTITSPPATLTATAHYSQMSNSHNIVINEETGFAYAVGTNTCAGGLHMINIQNPTSPSFAGCYSGDGYTHDAQCVIYKGPDTDYQGKEICFAYNTDTLTIIDVSNKSAPVLVSRNDYALYGYTHQGWLTEDHSFALANDEFDENRQGFNTRTLIWDLSDLSGLPDPLEYFGPEPSIDHNLYTRNGFAFESNYKSGLRILDLSNIATGSLLEVGYFDTYPSSNSTGYDGAWSNYPYFCSGRIAVSDINRGLFILQADALPNETCAAIKLHLQGGYLVPSLQSTKLNTEGLIPTTQPFTGAPWNYGGPESVPAYDVITANGKVDFFELNPEITDWVLLELRTGTAAASTVAKRAAFLTESGTVVDLDGRSLVKFPGVAPGNYYIVATHRNHQAIMSAAPVAINGPVAYDFSDAPAKAYGVNPVVELEADVYGLRGGDADANGSTTAFDLLMGWLPVNGTNGYLSGDFNLDGQATASDMLNVWLQSNGTSTQVPN